MKNNIFSLLILVLLVGAGINVNAACLSDDTKTCMTNAIEQTFASVSVADADALLTTVPACLPVTVANEDDNGDCVKVTVQDGGIIIMDCVDVIRVIRNTWGLTEAQANARYNCCIVILVDTDGSDLPQSVTISDDQYGEITVDACVQ